MQEIYKTLKNFGKVKANVPLARFTTFKIGGPAKFYIEVGDKVKTIELLNFLSGEGIAFYILGNGSNVVFPDDGYDGVVMRLKNDVINLDGTTITAGAGAALASVVNLALQNSLSGIEWAAGVPGTVGGAVRGNAGAMGKETSNCINEVEVWQDGEARNWPAKECGFGYRHSDFKNNKAIILEVKYELNPGDKATILAEMQKYLKQRSGRYPAYPSAGSFFKNVKVSDWPGDKSQLPPLYIERKMIPVGWLIEGVELKGYQIGGAKFSEEHGNFIVNFNNATQADVIALVEEAKSRVYNKYKVEIEPEVEIVR
ncbi:MAG TPA: UDP-N-acetylmuramate dehydrogenase [Patescibacteria group bacterium]|nr:UDP-N-acetylmuramate dehydrogenase [Patescibacteria group bacterium]